MAIVLVLQSAQDDSLLTYLLSIRHHRQLSFDFARIWPGSGKLPSA